MEQKTLSDYTKLTPDHHFLKEWTEVYGHDFSCMTYSEQIWLASQWLEEIDSSNKYAGNNTRVYLREEIRNLHDDSKKLDEDVKLGLAAALLQNLHQGKHFDGAIVEMRLSEEKYKNFCEYCNDSGVSVNETLDKLISNFIGEKSIEKNF
jgi:hypothetical protein